MKHATSGITNRTRFAGSWYSGSAAELEQQLTAALRRSGGHGEGIQGAILPHAGLAYSADGMAAGFSRINAGAVDQAVLLAPSHYVRLDPDTLYSAPFASHQTPLGEIPGLVPPEGMAENAEAIEREHAVELLLPFLRYTLPDVPLLVVLVPEISSLETISTLRDTLIGSLGPRERGTLFLASSDFTHYGPRFRYTPFGTTPLSEVEARVAEDDRAFARAAADTDLVALRQRMADGPISICGRYPVLLLSAVMKALGRRGDVVRYYTSNTVHEPSEDFVCYASVVYGSENPGE